MQKLQPILLCLVIYLVASVSYAALVVPTDIQQPGTQPGQVANLETPDKCDNCHGGYNASTEPAHNWRGSMMANAGRDPIFWATVAVAEQDFDGSGDLCIRCHSTAGWMGGRSTPTDGSALTAGDSDGVDCDFCHKATNPDNSELLGVQTTPFIANNRLSPATGFYGSGMSSLWGASSKLGPYSDAVPNHKFVKSNFHRSVDFCGMCHDVSNAAVGDLAHNNGAATPLPAGRFSGVPGSSVEGKAAFKNFPYMYGVVERTFSEHKSSALSTMRVADYNTLPVDLKGGAMKSAYDNSIVAGTGGNYADGTTRYFSCQTCHMQPVTGQGCNKNPPIRKDLPLHDMTGGNYWMPDAILYLNTQNKLRLGGGLTTTQIAAINDGKTRALRQLNEAVGLSVSGNNLRVVNRTGHKVISGYPEGRRMWLNVKWYGSGGGLVREDGAYGPMTVTSNGQQIQVNSILSLQDPNTKIYEAHYAMTQEWANQLISLGYNADMPLSFDRITGQTDYTLGQLAAQSPGTYHETFHFVLNNHVANDNRIPPYGFRFNDAKTRNSLPVPADQYGNPGPGGVYNYWDSFQLTPPANATSAAINMMYQPTSWEYIQFLHLANTGQNVFLANEGVYLLEAWRATGMAEPHVMATASWFAPAGGIPTVTAITPSSGPNMGTTNIAVLAGNNFAAGASVKLKRSGYSDITATNVTVESATQITCSIDLTGKATGLWDVVVTNPDTQSGTLVKGFGISIPNSMPVVATSIRSLRDPIATPGSMKFRFRIWGLVERIDSSTFWLNDGSGTRSKVFAPGYSGITNGSFASATGTADVSSAYPILVSSLNWVIGY